MILDRFDIRSCPYDLARWRFLVRAAFLAARERATFDGRLTGLAGTRLPSRRASESQIAIACLRLFTFPPLGGLPILSPPAVGRWRPVSSSSPLIQPLRISSSRYRPSA